MHKPTHRVRVLTRFRIRVQAERQEAEPAKTAAVTAMEPAALVAGKTGVAEAAARWAQLTVVQFGVN